MNPERLAAFIRGLVIFVANFFFVYFLLTGPAWMIRVSFAVSPPKQIPTTKTITKTAPATTLPIGQLPLPGQAVQETSFDTSQFNALEESELSIPKIKVNQVPIIWNSDPDEKVMLANLRNGVVHYKSTALPGAGGNTFITGHSSYYWWDKGGYKTVFVLLDKLENDDIVGLKYNGQLYLYQVYDKKVVNPDQVEVTAPTKEPILSLMTCVPIGTNLKRLVVQAKQIYPGSQGAIPSRPQPSFFLPGSSSLDLLPWR